MRKQGRHYKRQNLANPLISVIVRQQPLDHEQVVDLGLSYRMPFEQMREGKGTEEHYNTLACVVNIGHVLCEYGVLKEWLECIEKAQLAMNRVLERAKKLGKWGFDGEGLIDMRDALVVLDEQLNVATRKQVEMAIAEVKRRVS